MLGIVPAQANATALPATPAPTITMSATSFLFDVFIAFQHDETEFRPTGPHLLES